MDQMTQTMGFKVSAQSGLESGHLWPSQADCPPGPIPFHLILFRLAPFWLRLVPYPLVLVQFSGFNKF